MDENFIYEDIEAIIGHKFTDKSLLDSALTHSSWANENEGVTHNERQEFLGDAVLELCVSSFLFSVFPDAREGDLTRMRSRLVSTSSLAGLARGLGLECRLRLGKGEESQGGRQRDAILADALEAVLGAVFEDGGFAAAFGVVERLFKDIWPKDVVPWRGKDFKTRLQEEIQRVYKDRPLYTLIGSHGPEHAKVFEVRLNLPDGTELIARGPSLKRAEQEAARMALEAITGSIQA